MKKLLLVLITAAVAAEALLIAGCTKPDTTPPVVTIIGGNVTIFLGSTYVDQGATAVDNEDGNLTSLITVTNFVNPNLAGTYRVHYSVKDLAGNEGTADRMVTVKNQAYSLTGVYSVRDSVWGAPSAQLYIDSIMPSTAVNNRILVTRFANKVNAAVYMDVTANMTSLAVPSQTVICDNPPASYTFITNTSLITPSISGTPLAIKFDYQQTVNAVTTNARAIYTKQ